MSNREFPSHERITLNNFTAFSDETLEFVPGINVLVGENGTGKTHVMKALYAWQIARHLAEKGRSANYAQIFAETYGVRSNAELQRNKSRSATLSGVFGNDEWQVGLQQNNAADNGYRPKPTRPIYIPAMEMMAHARNMNGILRDYADFDRTTFDFIAMVTAQPILSDGATKVSSTMMREIESLKKLVPGEVEWNEAEQRFYLSEKERLLPFSIVAEGVRKVSAIHRLIQDGWIQPGGTLFWDEPEVNINPKWMDELVGVIVALARAKVQIFLATHSYVILKEIDLAVRRSKLDRVREDNPVSARFFALYKERGVTRTMATNDFSDLEPNPILDQYDQMLSADWSIRDREDRDK